MRTVQMTMEDELVEAVDAMANELGISRSAFTRDALQAALRRIAIERDERRHRRAYEEVPPAAGEFDLDDDQLPWGDEWVDS